MPAGTIAHSTLASATVAAPEETQVFPFSIGTSAFVNGTNVIAVEVHQDAITSSDIHFELQLQGTTAPVNLINYTDSWKYRDNNTRPAGWETTAFNDASWSSGAAELGYGDGDETTVVSYGSDANNKYITTYFRKAFTVTGLSGYSSFTINLVRDDGAVVYINGTEVIRDNMPTGTVTHSTLASSAISSTGESTPVSYTLSPCAFVEGTNTIAVEIHQDALNSSDISFKLQMTGAAGGGTPSLTRGPYLQAGSQTAITFRWRTDNPCLGKVDVGSAVGTYSTATASETCPTTEHTVRVTGLTADTKYYYRIGTTSAQIFQGASDNFFRTVPTGTPNRKLRFAAFGDCGRGNTTYMDQSYTQYQSYLSTNGIDAPDAWLLLGDNAYNAGLDAEYTTNFFNIYGGNILKNHKLYPSPGNHDYANDATRQDDHNVPYYSIFNPPSAGEDGGVASNKKEYYSYDIGNVHFLALDAYGEEGNKRIYDAGSPQVTWIQSDLAANTKKWVIAYFHHPPYTKGSHDSDTESELINMRGNLIPVLENLGVDMIINGHSHDYERSYLIKGHYGLEASFSIATHAVSSSNGKYTSNTTCPYVYNSAPAYHGTVYVLAGSTGNSGATQAGYPHNALPFAVNDGGMFFFEVDDNRLDAKMIRRDGSIFDNFTIIKDVNKTKSQTVVVGTPVTMTASWPGNYSWSTAAVSRSISVTPSALGTTNYTVTDNFGCITDQFSITATSTLPVNVINYDAVLKEGKVNLTWSTSSEQNSKYFTVERTQNQSKFEVVGKLNAAGQSTSERNYSLTDYRPLSGISYYRLSQTDIDNKIAYYDLKKIINGTDVFAARQLTGENGILVLQINSAKADHLTIRIYDLSGKEVWKENMNVNGGAVQKAITLRSGAYVWEVRNSKGEAVSKIGILK